MKYIRDIIFLTLIFYYSAFAHTSINNFLKEEESPNEPDDSTRIYYLDEIEVTNRKYETRIQDVIVPVEISNGEEIFKSSASTPSNILNNKPGLTLSGDGIWGTFTSVRGLSKNNIVSLIDGNRIETANDVAAGLSLIDVNDIRQIEVIKSGYSSLYGSGALGGIINIITEKGFYPENFQVNVSAVSSYGSVNKNTSGTLSFNIGSSIWFANLRGTLRSVDDTTTPDGVLENSQFRNRNYSFFSGYKFSENQELKFSYQNYSAEDVGIPGNSLFTNDAEVKYLKAKRELSSIDYTQKNLFESFIRFKAKIFYHVIDREVENKPHRTVISNDGTKRITTLKILPDGNHETIGGSLQFDMLWGNHFLIAGLEMWQRELLTTRRREVLIETIDTDSQVVLNSLFKIIGEKPIPDSKFRSTGLFVQDEIEIIKEKLKLTLGGRIDQIHIQNDEAFNPLYEISNGEYKNNPPGRLLIWDAEEEKKYSWSGNLSFLYSVTKDVDLTFAAAGSFRSPSLEERYQYIDLGSFIRVGNPRLEPEKGYFLDMGIRIWKNALTLTGNIFLNFLNDLVSETPGTFEERLSFINTNIGSARFFGFDLSSRYSFGNYILSGNLSYVNGSDIENNTYLPQIPPLNGSITFSYKPITFLQTEFTAILYADQDITSPQELKTPGYIIYDINLLSIPVKFGSAEVQIASGVDNITNKSYRNHLASFRGLINSEPGRNYFIKMKVNW